MIIVNIIIFKGKTRVFLYISIDYKYHFARSLLCRYKKIRSGSEINFFLNS